MVDEEVIRLRVDIDARNGERVSSTTRFSLQVVCPIVVDARARAVDLAADVYRARVLIQQTGIENVVVRNGVVREVETVVIRNYRETITPGVEDCIASDQLMVTLNID